MKTDIRITDKATGQVSAFAYDGNSHRMSDTETDPGGSSVTTQYLWCGNTICEQRDASDAVTARYYSEGEIHDGQRYYYAQDQVGSVSALVDATGNVVGRLSYDSYGNVIASSGDLPDYQYAGLFAHPSGLLFATYRAYDPEIGRWLNRDPMGERGGLNTYLYAKANPLEFFDLLGLDAECTKQCPYKGRYKPCCNGWSPKNSKITNWVSHKICKYYVDKACEAVKNQFACCEADLSACLADKNKSYAQCEREYTWCRGRPLAK